MENPEVMAKYQQFVEDYNSGMDRTWLCNKYRLVDDKFDSLLEFLRRKGFVFVEQRMQTPASIDYEIFGDEMQFVEVSLEPGSAAVADAGVMMYMESGIDMETVLGDGSAQSGGFVDKALGAGKRALSGASLFMTAFTNHGYERHKVAFAAPYPGKIIPLDLRQLGGEMICQKHAFLCAAKGISIGIYFQKDLRVGFFGGEGFIMQRVTGDGIAFVHAGGTLIARDLRPGETLRVDPGCIVAFQPGVQFDIQYVGGITNAMFGGEGAFFATVTGPGKVWLQSLPFSRLIQLISSRLPASEKGTNLLGDVHLPVKETAVVAGIGGLLGGLFSNRDDD